MASKAGMLLLRLPLRQENAGKQAKSVLSAIRWEMRLAMFCEVPIIKAHKTGVLKPIKVTS